MKSIIKNKYIRLLVVVIMTFTYSSCDIDDIVDPNGPSLQGIEENATLGELNTVVAGVESLMSQEIAFYYDVTGIVGREWYFFTNSDPRYTGELLGKGASTLDNAGFYGTRPYAGRFRVIKNTNILITAVNNSIADITSAEMDGYIGFARTVEAYSLLIALNQQFSNGIRTDISDPDALGGFVTYDQALTDISAILDVGFGLLSNAGSAFAFTLSSGFLAFDTPATFAQFNRGIKARVEMYRGNKSAVLTALNGSFMIMSGAVLDFGPSHYYSEAGGEQINQMFRTPDQSEALIAHPSFITDILPLDDRINKLALRPSGSRTLDGLSGDYDVTIWSSFNSPLKIMNNEELILLNAEANIGTDNIAAVNAINIIRNAHGLGNYLFTTVTALEDELLYNRRYSLFGLAHRWIDMRRYNQLGTLPIDRVDDDVWVEFPRPVSEVGVQGG